MINKISFSNDNIQFTKDQFYIFKVRKSKHVKNDKLKV
mgnify:CR=1 FL=1